MNEILKKASGYTPPELMLLSALGGGSVFAGLRLLTDMGSKLNPPKVEQNKIKLQLPENNGIASVTPGEAGPLQGFGKSAEPMQPDWYVSPLSALVGLPIGFLGTKALYDKYQENQGNAQIAEAKKNYTKQLMLAQQMNKMSEETPLVDAFCKAAAEELDKEAASLLSLTKGLINKVPGLNAVKGFTNQHKWVTPIASLGALGVADNYVEPATKSLTENAPNAMGFAPSAVPGIDSSTIMKNLPTDDASLLSAEDSLSNKASKGGNAFVNKLTGNYWGQTKDTWKALAGLGAAGTFGILLNNHLKKKEKEEKAQYPVGVEYAK
jgi:hypothetical protein